MFRVATMLAVIFAIFFNATEACAQAPTIDLTASLPVKKQDTTWNFPGGGTYIVGTKTLSKVTILLKITNIATGTSTETGEGPTTAINGNYTGTLNRTTYDKVKYKYYMAARLYVKKTVVGGQPTSELVAQTDWTECGVVK